MKTNNYIDMRIFLSDKGIEAIKKPLRTRIDAYGLDQLAKEMNIDFTEIKQFLSLKSPYGSKCISKLDTMLILLETDIYTLMQESIYGEFGLQTSENKNEQIVNNA